MTDPSPRIRLAALATHPVQYFAPVFRALSAVPQIDLTVYYCSTLGLTENRDPEFGVTFAWDIPLLEGYRHRFLKSVRLGPAPFDLITPGIAAEIVRRRYDAVLLHGYTHAADWLALSAARVAGAAVIVRGESNLTDQRAGWKRMLKSSVVKSFYRNADAAAYIGARNRDYYRAYGVPSHRLVFAPYCVDNAFFRARATKGREASRASLRAEFGLPADATVVLFSGKLMPKKRPGFLLEAFANAQRGRRRPAALLFAGDGELRSELQRRARELPDLYIKFAGFLNQTQISRAYAAADILALPSGWGETWGLAINEGMNYGLTPLVSDRVGCAGDLVQHGRSGFVVPANDLAQWTQLLRLLLDDGDLRRALGECAQARVEDWSVERCVDGLVAATQLAVSRRRSAPGRNPVEAGAGVDRCV